MVKDTSGLYGSLETNYQLAGLSLLDLEVFLNSGALVRKERVEERVEQNSAYQDWERRNSIRAWAYFDRQRTLRNAGSLNYSPDTPPLPKEIRREVKVPYPAAQINLNFLSAELKLGFVDHVRAVESGRVRLEYDERWERAKEQFLRGDSAGRLGQREQAATRGSHEDDLKEEPKNNTGKESKGKPVPERYPGQVELKFPSSNTVEVYDTRDRSTRTFRTPWDEEGYRLRIYLVGGNYVIEWKDGNFNQHTEVFPADHCRLNIKPR